MSVAETFQAMATPGSDITYIVSTWDKATNSLSLVTTGKGNLTEFKEQLTGNQPLFCAFRVAGEDRHEAVVSERTKIVEITYISPSVSPLNRNSVLNSKPERTTIFAGAALQIQSDDLEDFTMKTIGQGLLKIGGAHKPTHYVFGPGEEIPLTDL